MRLVALGSALTRSNLIAESNKGVLCLIVAPPTADRRWGESGHLEANSGETIRWGSSTGL